MQRSPIRYTDTNTKFPWLSPEKLGYLWRLVKSAPNQPCFSPDGILPFPVYKFNDDDYVIVGEEIGSGTFGAVHFGIRFSRNNPTARGEKCVVKIALSTLLNDVLDNNAWMESESKLLKQVHGVGESIRVQLHGEEKTILLMPFLGDISLASLLKKEDLMKQISVDEWMKLFYTLFMRLHNLHENTDHLHNDIKPDNIGVSLIETPNGWGFSDINYYDLGNAHLKNSRGVFGDPRFQPVESVLFGSLISSIKNESIDVYALGMSLRLVTDYLLTLPLSPTDFRKIRQSHKLFNEMTRIYQQDRPSLYEGLLFINAIQNERRVFIARKRALRALHFLSIGLVIGLVAVGLVFASAATFGFLPAVVGTAALIGTTIGTSGIAATLTGIALIATISATVFATLTFVTGRFVEWLGHQPIKAAQPEPLLPPSPRSSSQVNIRRSLGSEDRNEVSLELRPPALVEPIEPFQPSPFVVSPLEEDRLHLNSRP